MKRKEEEEDFVRGSVPQVPYDTAPMFKDVDWDKVFFLLLLLFFAECSTFADSQTDEAGRKAWHSWTRNGSCRGEEEEKHSFYKIWLQVMAHDFFFLFVWS